MSNEIHVKILHQGASKWNEWRDSQANSPVDLSGVNLLRHGFVSFNLTDTDFTGAILSHSNFERTPLDRSTFAKAAINCVNFKEANLSETNFDEAQVIRSIFKKANLQESSFRRATCRGSYFESANLQNADLTQADLREANFHNAELSYSILDRTDLRDANFHNSFLRSTRVSEAAIGGTIFAGVNLRQFKDIESVGHLGPSEVTASTFVRSAGELSIEFLRGCGLNEWQIEAAKLYRRLSPRELVDAIYRISDLRCDPLIQFHSCFISFSNQDAEFAKLLFIRLQSSGVRCWFAPEDMKIGDRIRDRIDESIYMQNKLMVILSKHSIASQWIEQEVETALQKEREEGCDVLFPIRLDDTVMTVRTGWPALIKKTRHMGDFSTWKQTDEFQKSYKRLLNDLRVNRAENQINMNLED